MKHYVQYPYGIIIKPVKREPYGSSPDPLYELSDNNNKRRRIRLSQIMTLATTNNVAVRGYPRATICTDTSSRNKYVQNESGAYVKVYNGPGVKKDIKMPDIDTNAHYAKFTIIQDGTERPGMEYKVPEYIVPIEPIEGDTYYGREDCRTIYNVDVYRGYGKIQYSRK